MTPDEAARAVVLIAVHYGLTAKEIKTLEQPVLKLMLRHIGTPRPCNHPGSRLIRNR